MPKKHSTSAADSVRQIFTRAVELGASDVHIAAGQPVFFRISGTLVAQTKEDVTPAFADAFVRAVLGDAAHKRFADEREVDMSYQIASGARFRVNCSYERDCPSLVARIIPVTIPTLDEIGLAEVADRFCHLHEGLVLFTGPTGTGKSTSLAAILQHITQTRAVNVITLEDPIEFLFPKSKGIVRQRQYLQDFHSFAEALKHILRQDPEIVMVVEMRDPETIAAALTLAETGHLIFATLHTPNTAQTIDRIIDAFPPHQQQQIRSQLSLSLKGIVAQRLLPAAKGGLVAQRELLINTPAVAHIIRENRLPEMKSVLQTGGDDGMFSFERDAKRLYKAGLITKEVYEWAVGG